MRILQNGTRIIYHSGPQPPGLGAPGGWGPLQKSKNLQDANGSKNYILTTVILHASLFDACGW